MKVTSCISGNQKSVFITEWDEDRSTVENKISSLKDFIPDINVEYLSDFNSSNNLTFDIKLLNKEKVNYSDEFNNSFKSCEYKEFEASDGKHVTLCIGDSEYDLMMNKLISIGDKLIDYQIMK